MSISNTGFPQFSGTGHYKSLLSLTNPSVENGENASKCEPGREN